MLSRSRLWSRDEASLPSLRLCHCLASDWSVWRLTASDWSSATILAATRLNYLKRKLLFPQVTLSFWCSLLFKVRFENEKCNRHSSSRSRCLSLFHSIRKFSIIFKSHCALPNCSNFNLEFNMQICNFVPNKTSAQIDFCYVQNDFCVYSRDTKVWKAVISTLYVYGMYFH